MRMEMPFSPAAHPITIVIKTILRDGGHIEPGFKRVVARPGSGMAEPQGDLKKLCQAMAHRGEITQYRVPGKATYVWGMRGITPEACKDRDELMKQMQLLAHKLERSKSAKWIALDRHAPEHMQRILAFVPILANAGHVGQVIGRYDENADLVTVDTMIPLSGDRHHIVVQYEFTHWMAQQDDPGE